MLKLFSIIFFVITLAACNQASNQPHLSDPIEAGREFIDALLKGNHDVAKKYLLEDSTNVMYFDRFTEYYKKRPDEEKQGYKDANIIINSTENVTDSVMIINYSNTFKNSPSKIKLVRVNNEWRVDFKYTFSGNL